MKKILLIFFGLVLTLNLCLFSTVKNSKLDDSMFELLTKANAQTELPQVNVCWANRLHYYINESTGTCLKWCEGEQVDCSVYSNC